MLQVLAPIRKDLQQALLVLGRILLQPFGTQPHRFQVTREMRKSGQRQLVQKADAEQTIELLVHVVVAGLGKTQQRRLQPGFQLGLRFDDRFGEFQSLDASGKQFA